MKRVALLSAALLLSVTASFGSGVLVEAESFRDKGGWAVDQQFMDQMGSPYLIAHGMGKPVADAVTTVEFPETGTYRVYVRTFNWVAPWYDGEGPGKFALRVGSRKLSATLGCTGSEWMWQCAGKVSVRKGPVSVSLTDLSGFDGRCDAVYFTTEEGDVPPSGSAELAAFRKRMLGIPATPPNRSISSSWAAASQACAPRPRRPGWGAASLWSTTARCWAATTAPKSACIWAASSSLAPTRDWAA